MDSLWFEIPGTIFGLICVWLTVRQHIWCWPTGLVSVVLYVVVFYEAKLYSDLVLQVVYIFMQLYGWYHWLYGGAKRTELPVTTQPPAHTIGWWIFALIGSALWGYGMATYTDAAAPYWDAFIAVASLVAQWLMARKKLESWWFWIAVDCVAVGVYASKKLYVTTGLYAVFLILAISGWLAWRKSWLAEAREPAVA